MGGGAHFLKRIPRIQFPQRHPKSSTSASTAQTQDATSTRLGCDVPTPPKNQGEGGKASLQPKPTPITAREIDTIILGGRI
ncbi:uncharacterized protein LOC126803413 [Argentina anserina]|uniref:uncharacterized protein LOC126803413 n=1 Tax=Argentina anserina TaxID=57926 RepID=UPI0021764B99|nr:uncharacterized protein LOC126803413 [Potentilla anserina]